MLYQIMKFILRNSGHLLSGSTRWIYFAFFIYCGFPLIGQKEISDWDKLQQRAVPEWYGKAKFGIFIHWGIYSVPSWATNSYADGFGSNYAEWYWQRLHTTKLKIHAEFRDFHQRVFGQDFKYQDFAYIFKCELFDADRWAEIIRKSGARYVVLTSKHHDGYCLWPSSLAPGWNAKDTGPKRDLVAEITRAVRKSGLHMGLYYSLYEWYNPLYLQNIEKYVKDYMTIQVKDLVNRYQPDLLWFDGDWEHPSGVWQTNKLCHWLYEESPVASKIVINDRLGNDTHSKYGSFQTSEYGRGNLTPGRLWEETRGIGQSFGYNRNENLEEYASSTALIHELIKVVSGGGNLLLNIGPSADGSIPVIMQQRLKDIGDWLSINGEAVYDSHAPDKALLEASDDTIYATQKDGNNYIFMLQWKNTITLKTTIIPKEITLLGYPESLEFIQDKESIRIALPPLTPDVIPCQHAWTLKIR